MKLSAAAAVAVLLVQPSLGSSLRAEQPLYHFPIPENWKNGVYEVTQTVKLPNDNWRDSERAEFSVAQHEIDPWTIVAAKKNDTKHLKVDSDLCRTGILNASEEELARRKLENFCEMYDPRKNTIIVAVHGRTLWYACNLWGTGAFPWNKQSCSRDELRAASIILDERCGNHSLGSFKTDTHRYLEYGRVERGMPVCKGYGLP